MQQSNDIFSKIISLKTKILAAMVGLLVIYAVVGVIIVIANDSEAFSLIGKILIPLGIIGVATVLSVDCFYKLAKSETIIKTLGLITLIIGVLDAILLTLMIWEIIPAYETVKVSGYFSMSIAPSIWYKLIMSLLSITAFTFLSSIVFGIKENYQIIRISKYITVGFLAVSSFVSIISNFADSYDLRFYLIQAVSWVAAICLGITVFYLSKTTAWEEKASSESPSEPKTPPKPIESAPFRLATVEAPNAEAAPVQSMSAETLTTAQAATEAPTLAEPSTDLPPLLNPTDQTSAETQPFGHIINPTEKKG